MSLVISRTPFRVSFFGGGSDYPAWYRDNGGSVLSTSINKYCYITCRYRPPFFAERHRVVWSHIETVNSVAEILHPAVREGFRMLGFDDQVGIELHHQGDLPARTGIGSSSSFAVGLINALSALRGQKLSAHDLALAAIELEQTKLGDHVGSQDQMASAYGGLNIFKFHQDGSITADPVSMTRERSLLLEGRLMVFFTGTTRLSSGLARDLISGMKEKSQQINDMQRMVETARLILERGDIDDFGRLLHETWCLKRQLGSRVSTDAIDEIYSAARSAGALGGKLLGAGESGFMIFYVPDNRQADVLRALKNLLNVSFGFDRTGSTIIYKSED